MFRQDVHPSETLVPATRETAPADRSQDRESNAIARSAVPSAIVTELSDEAKLKMEVIQSLLEAGDRTTYVARLQEAATKLGKSVRTVRRLVKKWEQEGLVGLAQTQRADKGKHRVDEDWQKFIIRTYQEGNKGSKRMTPKQVFLQVQATAEDLGVKSPSHTR